MAERRRFWVSFLTRIFAVAIIVAVGGAIFGTLYVSRPGPPPLKSNEPLARVLVMEAAFVPVQRQWTGFGTAEPMDSADVPAQVSAVVVEVPDGVLPGATVSLDDLLARLDPTDFDQQIDVLAERITGLDAQLEQTDIEEKSWKERLELAVSETAIAHRDYDRVKSLYDDGDAKEVELDRALGQVNAAERFETQVREEVQKMNPKRLGLQAQKRALQAERRIAETNLARTEITSPLDGVVERIEVEKGEQVSPGQTVARIVDLRTIEIPIRLPASARQYVRRGDSVRIESTGAVQSVWQGKVDRIAPADETDSRTFAVYTVVHQSPQALHLLTPGKFVRGVVTSERSERRMVVPRRSIAGDRMLVVEQGRIVRLRPAIAYYVSRQFPELGLDGEDYWAVLDEPLRVGTLVVLNGAIDLPTGARVQEDVVNGSAEAVAAGSATSGASSADRPRP